MSPFIFGVDFDIEAFFINADVENIRATADLAIFYIALLVAATDIYKGGVGFTTKRTAKVGGILHI